MGQQISKRPVLRKVSDKSVRKTPSSKFSREMLSSEPQFGIFKREPQHRIFVNRSLYMDKIKFFGFDMDYTLALYISPEYEALSFRLLVNRLLELGYPTEIGDFEYDPTFPVRGLWFDSKYGTLLKMDAFGHILVAVKGFKIMSKDDIRKLYPSKFLEYEAKRVQIMNTLFELPEMYLLACMIDYFTTNSAYTQEPTAVRCGEQYMSFQSMHRDVMDCMDFVHSAGSLKEKTISLLNELVLKDERLPIFLDRVRERGAKTFLVTNSGYAYTQKVLSHLLGSLFEKKNPKDRDWVSYFDYLVVDANKPEFFSQGRTLREIDMKTGKLRIGFHNGPLQKGRVYAGGSCELFSELIGSRGQDVLYIGDHIFGDILMSKTKRGWRTFLVIPELVQEIFVWTSKRDLYSKLEQLELDLKNAYKNMDSSSVSAPDTNAVQKNMMAVMHEMDMEYGMLGSLFKSGSRQTFFASQVSRFADLYSGTFLNLLYYPFCYLFKAPAMLMPHELTVEHLESEGKPQRFVRSRSLLPAQFELPRIRAETPKTITHYIDVE